MVFRRVVAYENKKVREMNSQQLELGFGGNGNATGGQVVGSRLPRQRARWWFAQMYKAVDAALDWRTPPPVTRVQGHLNFIAR